MFSEVSGLEYYRKRLDVACKRRISRKSQFDYLENLHETIIEVWDRMPQSYIKKLIESMPNRYAEVILNWRRPTNYWPQIIASFIWWVLYYFVRNKWVYTTVRFLCDSVFMLTISQLVLYNGKYVGFQYVSIFKSVELFQNGYFVPTDRVLGEAIFISRTILLRTHSTLS